MKACWFFVNNGFPTLCDFDCRKSGITLTILTKWPSLFYYIITKYSFVSIVFCLGDWKLQFFSHNNTHRSRRDPKWYSSVKMEVIRYEPLFRKRCNNTTFIVTKYIVIKGTVYCTMNDTSSKIWADTGTKKYTKMHVPNMNNTHWCTWSYHSVQMKRNNIQRTCMQWTVTIFVKLSNASGFNYSNMWQCIT